MFNIESNTTHNTPWTLNKCIKHNDTSKTLNIIIHHSIGASRFESSAPPLFGLSTTWANSSPAVASRCESEVYETYISMLDRHKILNKECNFRLDSYLSERGQRSLVRPPWPPRQRLPSSWRRSPRRRWPSSWMKSVISISVFHSMWFVI
jgi:hypothetical protein